MVSNHIGKIFFIPTKQWEIFSILFSRSQPKNGQLMIFPKKYFQPKTFSQKPFYVKTNVALIEAALQLYLFYQ
jgi:hypothetical protein